MKKIYENPTTDIVTISLSGIMVTSDNNYGKPEEGQDLSEVDVTNATEGNLSRRRTVWDD